MSLEAIRLSYCRRCPRKCEPYRNGTIQLANPQLACPIGRWKAVSMHRTASPARFEAKTVSGQPKRLGDRVERLAKPIAKLLRLDCLENGRLKPQSPCARRRDALNRLAAETKKKYQEWLKRF